MSYKEAQGWLEYIKSNGPVAPAKIAKLTADHLEWTSAKICWAVMRAAGVKKAEISWFLPKKEENKEGSAQDVFRLLLTTSKAGKK